MKSSIHSGRSVIGTSESLRSDTGLEDELEADHHLFSEVISTSFLDESYSDDVEDEILSVLLENPRTTRANQAGILSVAKGAEETDVEQMKKIISFVTCEIVFGQNVYELMFVSMYRIWILISYPIKKINS